MDDWEKINKTTLLEKNVYSHLKMEGITDADYAHAEDLVKILK